MTYGRAFAAWRDDCAGPWRDYTRHRFVQGLGDGTLPRAAFLRYLVQDYRFLIHFSRAWALAVVKSDTLAEMRACTADRSGAGRGRDGAACSHLRPRRHQRGPA